MPEQSLSKPEQSLNKLEHALSQPAYHNTGPILAFCVPRLQVPYRILPENPFLLPRKVSAGADFGSLLSKSLRSSVAGISHVAHST
jgi:hypothetical protein